MHYTKEELRRLDAEKLEADVVEAFRHLYDEKEAEIGAAHMLRSKKMILLRVVDNRWMDHIDAMDELKQGIGLRSLGQIDPALAYSNEGYDMFEEMIGDIREETVRFCFNVTVNTSSERKKVIAGGEGRKEDYQDEAARPTVCRGPMVGGGAGQMPQAPKPRGPRKPETYGARCQGRKERPEPCGDG